jgi:hypothetical protein
MGAHTDEPDQLSDDHSTNPPHVCFAVHHHRDRLYTRVCLTCLRELIGRVDELERRVRTLDTLRPLNSPAVRVLRELTRGASTVSRLARETGLTPGQIRSVLNRNEKFGQTVRLVPVPGGRAKETQWGLATNETAGDFGRDDA